MAITSDELKRQVFPGESGGDYNALYGYSNRPGGAFAGVNLTDMTVDQALQFASPSGPYAASVRGQIGRTATPMGAYQVVGSTLAAAKRGLGLSGNERMTPGLQDKIGMWIYQNQGPGAWSGWGTTKSTKGGSMPMGMFGAPDVAQGDDRGSFWSRLALAANSLRTNPDPNLAQLLESRIQRRADQRTATRTSEWLVAQGRGDLAQALATGGIDPKTAIAMAYQKPDAVNGVAVDGKIVNPQTGEVIYDPYQGQTPPLSAEQLTSLNALRDDATTASSELSMMQDAWGNINTFYKNPGSVSDRGLVIAFAKILDPTSVVRESESAAIANSGSLSAGLRSMLLNTLQGGGNLPDEIRTEILNLSREMYAAKLPRVQQRINLLQQTAERAGLPPDLVFGGNLAAPQSAAPAAPGAGQPTISPGAQKYLP